MDKDVIATTDIQTTSNLILQYENKDEIDKDTIDIMPSSAEAIASLQILNKFFTRHENQEKKFEKTCMY